MNAELLVKSACVHHLVRLPSGVCCGLCGFVLYSDEEINNNSDENDAETNMLDKVVEGVREEKNFEELWQLMEAHIREKHCETCVMCGKLGTIELATGRNAAWIRRTRNRNLLTAIRSHRRGHGSQREISQGCTHCFCESCALSAATTAANSNGYCPIEGCMTKIEPRILSIFVPGYDPKFHCGVCGELFSDRDKIALHEPDPFFTRHNNRHIVIQEVDEIFPPFFTGNDFHMPDLPFLREPLHEPPTSLNTLAADNVRVRRFSAQASNDPLTTRKRPRRDNDDESETNNIPSSCELCAPCAQRWLAIQARDGAVYVRCPTPHCRRPLSRDTLELLMHPKAYSALLKKTRVSFETRLRELQSSATRLPLQSTSQNTNDGTIDFLRWANEATRACPSCHVIIYRSEGCSHMACACGANFDWDNAERIDGTLSSRTSRPSFPNVGPPHNAIREGTRASRIVEQLRRFGSSQRARQDDDFSHNHFLSAALTVVNGSFDSQFTTTHSRPPPIQGQSPFEEGTSPGGEEEGRTFHKRTRP
mmetsp:Transcript_21930/g.28407  ORF Transcript_21930/g.28407 Transcript_21930/m.28407 type:complete len:535 (+) Transcript_21930:131-1735(+)